VLCELAGANGVFVLEPLARSASTEYKLVTSSPLDREQRDEYRLEVVCRDGGVPALSRSRELVVRVTDANDHAPQFERGYVPLSVSVSPGPLSHPRLVFYSPKILPVDQV